MVDQYCGVSETVSGVGCTGAGGQTWEGGWDIRMEPARALSAARRRMFSCFRKSRAVEAGSDFYTRYQNVVQV